MWYVLSRYLIGSEIRTLYSPKKIYRDTVKSETLKSVEHNRIGAN